MNLLINRLLDRLTIFYINNCEIRLGKCLPNVCLRYRLCSWVYENNTKYFYFGLTLLGGSVTMSKRKKKLTGGLR